MQEAKLKTKDFKTFFPKPWPAIWAWIYLAIIVLGLATPGNDLLTFIKIAGIFLCFLYAVQFFKTDHLLKLAMLMTSIADVILALNNTAISGIATFFLVQIIHLFRLSNRQSRSFILVFISIAGVTIISDIILNFTPLLYIVCAFYAIALTINLMLSWRWFKAAPKAPRALFALAGFILFLFCDSCTVISYFSLTNILPFFLYAPANFFAWLFYYPSQVLISNSSKNTKNQLLQA